MRPAAAGSTKKAMARVPRSIERVNPFQSTASDCRESGGNECGEHRQGEQRVGQQEEREPDLIGDDAALDAVGQHQHDDQQQLGDGEEGAAHAPRRPMRRTSG